MSSSIFTPLDHSSEEIRLLNVQPSLLASSPLHCELRKVDLANAPSYQALSYVWGTDVPQHEIFVNSEPLKVRENLYSALRRLRSRIKTITLWIDAICINQENVQERNHQVARMRQIYAQAQEVIIWLGQDADDSGLAMRSIRSWSRLLRDTDGSPGLPLSKLGPHMFHLRTWRATARLFERSWWRRVWVVQEVVVSRFAVVICGQERCEWRSILRARTAWELLSTPEVSRFLSDKELEMVHHCEFDIAMVMYLQSSKAPLPKRMGLLSLIRLMTRFEATVPRDRLYALLGIEDVVDIAVSPDYGKSTEEVYVDFVRAFVRDKRRLSILGGAGIGYPKPEPSLDLPSWVPDLRHLAMVDEYSSFAASGNTEAVASFSPDSRLLSVQGIVCGAIDMLVPRPSDNDVIIRRSWLNLVLGQKRLLHPTGITTLQAYFRTLIADDSGYGSGRTDFRDSREAQRFFDLAIGFLFLLGSDAINRAAEAGCPSTVSANVSEFSDYVRFFAHWRREVPTLPSEEAILEPFIGSVDSQSRLPWPSTADPNRGFDCRFSFASAVGNACRNRSFFLTKEGFMGLAPPGTRETDLLCTVLGCELPLVIRPSLDQYSLVGSCYVYGMMKGEVLETVLKGKLYTQMFVFH